MIMAQKYYYLEPNQYKPNYSTLHETSSVTNNGNEGRWIPGVDSNTYKNMVRPQFYNQDNAPLFKFYDIDKVDMSFYIYYPEIKDDLDKLGIKHDKTVLDCIKKYINYVDFDFNYISYNKGLDLKLYSHKKGTFSAKVEKIMNIYDSRKVSVNNNTKTDPLLKIPDDIKVKGEVKFKASDIGKCIIYVNLSTTSKQLSKLGEYDIGADWRSDGKYCFYCAVDKEYLNYGENYKYPFTTIKDHEIRLNHSHKTQVSKSTATGSTYNSKLMYKNTAAPSGDSLSKVDKLGYGSVGDYIDGIATVPFIMLELRASENAETGYNISLPTSDGKGMNSIVSLSHERHMSDSYNTFSLQLFDKNALDVEAKLLLGFRYVTFYYTDFVSTSKRFKGMVLNYKTTITGKGLMLTLEGYTSNANVYIGKDSIPWSILCEVNDISFYYWMNNAKEYHGELKVTQWKDNAVYNSTDGFFVSPLEIDEDSASRLTYSLKVPVEKQKEDDEGYEWQSYNFYYSNIPLSVREQYEPHVHMWSLSWYNEHIREAISLKFPNDGLQLNNKRPSDIVALICMINGWESNITPTKSVSEIPDQLSMPYIEYIKEKLIPISMSDEEPSSTNYYFWFDDEGVANYAPYNANTENVKKLYFNSVEHKDSYPLIGFTSATNGSVLMVADATNVMEAINPYTGDALSLTSISGAIKDESYLKVVKESSEWYSTNRKIIERSDDSEGLKYVSYSNMSSVPSESDLRKKLVNRYGTVTKYTYKASLDVYGCADISPGDYIDIYIYLDNGVRSDDPTSTEITEQRQRYNEEDVRNNLIPMTDYRVETYDEVVGYKGNITMHHTSGRYMVTKITDSVSAGRYISSLEVLKISDDKVLKSISFVEAEEGSSEREESQLRITEDKDENERVYSGPFTSNHTLTSKNN